MNWPLLLLVLFLVVGLTYVGYSYLPRTRDQRLDRDWAGDPGRDDAPATMDPITGSHLGAGNIEAYKRMGTDVPPQED